MNFFIISVVFMVIGLSKNQSSKASGKWNRKIFQVFTKKHDTSLGGRHATAV